MHAANAPMQPYPPDYWHGAAMRPVWAGPEGVKMWNTTSRVGRGEAGKGEGISHGHRHVYEFASLHVAPGQILTPTSDPLEDF